MSTNFTGVTFAKQKVTPSDDAIIRRAILPDGILYGCELSYSGSTLTMAAGQLLICGRQIRHPASQNWAVIDATSGFARLLLTIDLTKTSTKETFEQVVDSIEYASSEDGFPDLEQTDINVSGSRYQVVACVVSLGTGGITGIVSQLGKSVVESSGGLNFSLVGGLTQPADPAENTIWVPTDVDITSYVFSPVEPAEPTEGMVWITTGSSSLISFNALKKNAIVLYPLFAQQYVGGIWVDVNASIYQNGWKDMVTDIVFYENGAFNEDMFGAVSGSFTDQDSSIRVYSGNSITAEKPININAFDRIEITVGSADYCTMHVTLTPEDSSEEAFTVTEGSATGNKTWTIDLSSVTRNSLCYLTISGSGTGTYYTPYFDFSSVVFRL